MNLGDKYLIKSKTFIEKGFAPAGSILEITKIDKDIISVIITPFINGNDERKSIEINTTKNFIEGCSTMIN